MPKKSGLEFYNDIVVNNREKMFPVLVLTGRLEFEKFFKDIEADGFVPKPIDFAKLVQEVDRIFLKYNKEQPKKTAKNLLIVEDNDETLDRIVGIFVRAGFTVHCIKAMGDLTDQMPSEPLDLVIAKLLLCDLISSLKGVPKLMKADTATLIYTTGGSNLNKEIVIKLCEKSGIKATELVWSDSAPDLLKRSKEVLGLN